MRWGLLALVLSIATPASAELAIECGAPQGWDCVPVLDGANDNTFADDREWLARQRQMLVEMARRGHDTSAVWLLLRMSEEEVKGRTTTTR